MQHTMPGEGKMAAGEKKEKKNKRTLVSKGGKKRDFILKALKIQLSMLYLKTHDIYH